MENRTHIPQLGFLIKFLLLFVPLVHAPFFSAAIFSAPKFFVFELTVAAILLAWAFHCFKWRVCRFKKSIFNFALLFLVLAALASAFFATATATAFFGVDGRFLGFFNFALLVFICFAVFQNFSGRAEIERLLAFSLGAASLVALYGFAQSFESFARASAEFFMWSLPPNERPFSTLGHSLHLASFLAMHLPISAYFMTKTKGVRRAFFGLLLCFFTLVIFLSASKAGLFAAILFFALFIAFKFYESNKKKRLKILQRILLTLLTLGIFSYVFAAQIREIPVVQRNLEMIEILVDENRTLDRTSFWLSAFSMFLERPIFGQGFASFADAFNRFRRLDYRVEGEIQDLTVPQSAHNEFLNILSTQGVVGFGAYMFFLVLVLGSAWKFLRADSSQNPDYQIVKYLFCVVLVYLFYSFMSFGVLDNLLLFFVVCAALQSLTQVQKSTVRVCEFRKICFVICLLLSFFLVNLSLRHFLADHMKYKAQRAENLAQALNFYDTAIRLKPYEYQYYADLADYALAQSYLSGDLKQTRDLLKTSIANYKTAISINSNHPIVYKHLALAFEHLAQTEKENGNFSTHESLLEEAWKIHEKAIQKGVNNPIYLEAAREFATRTEQSEKADLLRENLRKIRPEYPLLRAH